MTYQELEKVTEGLKTVNIKGKEYAQVPERVKGFRQLYPEGSISTEIVSLSETEVTMIAKVRDDKDNLLATGMAHEEKSASYINKTSYVENCETSAVGRALGFLGIGIDASMCSAEELVNAVTNQDKPQELKGIITEKEAKVLEGMVKDDPQMKAYILKKAKVNDFKELKADVYTSLVQNWDKNLKIAHES